MASITVGVAFVRCWNMPRVFALLSGFLLLLSGLVTGLGLVSWRPLWQILDAFGVDRKTAQPLAAVALVGVWLILTLGSVVRTLVRWFAARYEHHGLAIGAGPLYFYFRRRRAS
jgi:hypothetical protein